VFKGLGVDECITRAVSLFSDRKEAEKRLKLPKGMQILPWLN
jgi:hypothetical protein